MEVSVLQEAIRTYPHDQAVRQVNQLWKLEGRSLGAEQSWHSQRTNTQETCYDVVLIMTMS